MKFSKLSQLLLVSGLGLSVAALISACDVITVDYVYVASSAGTGSSGNGQIDIFAADSISGALRPIDTTVSSGGIDPVSITVDTAYENLYAANAGTTSTLGSIVHFTIGLDGGLTQKEVVTLNAASPTPVAVAVNNAGTYLYVISKVPQASGTPCVLTDSGSLTVYSLSSGTIGAQVASTQLAGSGSDVIVPTGLTVLANNNAVFVSAYDQSAYNPGCTTSSTANPGLVFGYTVASGGILNKVSASPWNAGIRPSAIVSDPTNSYVYITDYTSNQLIAYTILDGSRLNFLPNGPFKTGNEPSAITMDPRGRFIYLTNQLDDSVSAYTIDLATGTPTVVVNTTGNATNTTEAEPVALVVDPALGQYVYTANYLGSSISGFSLNAIAGSLKVVQASPFPTGSEPTSITAIPHGNHATQVVDN